MIIDRYEYEDWLHKETEASQERYVSKKLNRKHPRLEKQRDFRKSKSPQNSGHWFNKESNHVKKFWKKKVRMKLKRNLYEEMYYNVYNKDVKTYGWMTW